MTRGAEGRLGGSLSYPTDTGQRPSLGGGAIELSEDELVDAIARVLSGSDPGVAIGIGDDAAVLEPGGGQLVFTTDLLVEGVHFERGSSSARDLGAKAVTVNVSDVAAMSASPRYAIAAVAVPADVDAAWVIELTGGMREACAAYGLALVGGDTNRAELIVLSVAVVGEVAPGRAVTRSGARPGDRIVVTGSLGAAAGGLAISKAPPDEAATALSEPWGRELAAAFARPVARVGEAQILARAGATSMMDLSDGLALDLSRLCAASDVGARVTVGTLPIAEALQRGAEALRVDALRLAVSGGEDYELLATVPEDAVETARAELHESFGTELSDVGAVVQGSGVIAVREDGLESALDPVGWDHFGRG